MSFQLSKSSRLPTPPTNLKSQIAILMGPGISSSQISITLADRDTGINYYYILWGGGGGVWMNDLLES